MNKYQLAADLIIKHEGFTTEPYYCASGKLTIGYGRTHGVKPGDKTTRMLEETWLEQELNRIDEIINHLVKPHMKPYQMAALMSFIYNVGQGAFEKSTLLRLINEERSTASYEFLRWVKGNNHEVLPGLVLRRVSEYSLFNGDFYGL